MGDVLRPDQEAPKSDNVAKYLYKALQQYGGGINDQVNRAILPHEQYMAEAGRYVGPQNQQTGLNLYQQFAPQYNRLQNRLADVSAKSEKARFKKFGIPTIGAAQGAAQAIDPEFYKSRENTYNKLQTLLNEPVSGGEIEAITRGINRLQPGANVQGAANTAANAQLYGDAARQRQMQGLQMASALNPQFKTTGVENIFSMGTSMGKGYDPNKQAINTGVTGQGADNTMQMVSSFFGPQTSAATQADAGRRTAWDKQDPVNKVCCFIFLEIYNGKLPWWVIHSRDRYYREEPMLAIGYKKMAKWLVPLMRRSKLVSHLVNITMVKPLSSYGAYDYCVNKHGWVFKPVRNFWFSVWRKYAI